MMIFDGLPAFTFTVVVAVTDGSPSQVVVIVWGPPPSVISTPADVTTSDGMLLVRVTKSETSPSGLLSRSVPVIVKPTGVLLAVTVLTEAVRFRWKPFSHMTSTVPLPG